jgi:hypothetical protein
MMGTIGVVDYWGCPGLLGSSYRTEHGQHEWVMALSRGVFAPEVLEMPLNSRFDLSLTGG